VTAAAGRAVVERLALGLAAAFFVHFFAGAAAAATLRPHIARARSTLRGGDLFVSLVRAMVGATTAMLSAF